MSNPLKKTMVFLGLAEDELEETGERPAPAPAAETAAPAAAPRPAAQKAPVTPLRKVTPTRAPAAPAMNEILTVHPSEYRDAAAIAESFRDGIPVILNLSRMNDADAKRLIDFASGLSMGLRGRIERVTSKVFLLSPEHIATASDEDSGSETGSFFVSPSA
ncbi:MULTISPECIES: cell division protein SepF [Leucobacter]|uniref:Cell division protein SepF n=2 Tax=Leucobacter TaxID=55968 RepID=A0ABP4XW78_9MICO|nr:cell division protein SepF [Leucobacter sp. Ag1]KKI20164.1 cell division protein SepF [Leucobacter sp. Ag1]